MPPAPTDPTDRTPLTPLPRALHRARHRPGAAPERSWTPVGTLDAGVLARVDDAGLVHPDGAAWSLDWWVGAEDRWHHPSVEVAVRRSCPGDAPVVETAMRVPGGDVVHRAFGVRARAGGWSGPAVALEVENRTAVPVALALVLRPVLPDGAGRLARVEVDGARVVADDGRVVLVDRPPRDVVDGPAGTVADRLADHAGGAVPVPGRVAEAGGGPVEVAVVVPLAHTATVRVLLPVVTGRARRGPAPAEPWDAPAADGVVAGWTTHRGSSASVLAPEPAWPGAVAWAGDLLRLAGADAVGELLDPGRAPGAGPGAAARAATIAEALAVLGATDACELVADALAGAQRRGGEVRLGDRGDGSVALLWAAGAVLGSGAGARRAEGLLAPVGASLARLRRAAGRGPLGADVDAAVRAARALVPGLLAVGQPEVAEDALRLADALGVSGPTTPVAPGGSVGDGPTPASTLDRALAVRRSVRSRLPASVAAVRDLWADHADAGRSDAVDAEGRAVGGSGFDVAELSARLLALLDLFVVDGARGPELLAVWPPTWTGAPVEVRGVHTAWGVVGAALRWHGDRPALLWEVEPARGLDPGTSAPLVRAPGPDPGWEAAGWTGEALLAPVAPLHGAGPPPVGEGQSFS